MPGVALADETVVPPQIEGRLAAHDTAENHLAAARLYQQQAERAHAAAKQYAATAATIRPIEDPKGVRRSALMTAAQARQKLAGEMQQLAAAHQATATTTLGQPHPQDGQSGDERR